MDYTKKKVFGYILKTCIALWVGALVSMAPFMKNVIHQAGSVSRAVNVSTLAELKKELSYTSANAVLTKNITIDGPLEINKHNATIDLNGHKLSGLYIISGEKDYCVFKIAKGIKRTTIMDSVGTGQIYSGTGLQGGGISTRGEVTVKNVKFVRCRSSYNGGTICAYNGSNVKLENCTISEGGGARGGGLYIESGSTVTISNSTIEKCESDSLNGVDGGGICNNGTLTLNNVTIKNNKTKGLGGGIYNRGTITLKGTNTITGNKANDGGGGIYNVSEGNSVFVRDTLVVKDNNKGWGSDIEGPDNVFLKEGAKLVVDGALSDDSDIWVNIGGSGRGYFTKNLSNSKNRRVFHSDKGEDVFLEQTDFEMSTGSDEAYIGNTEAILSYNGESTLYSTLKDGWGALANKGRCNLRLVKDCEISSRLDAYLSYISAVLDLNGHVLKRTGANTSVNGEVIRLDVGANITIRDSKKTGMITGGSNSNDGGGGAITVGRGASCKIYDVTISGNESYYGGGAITTQGYLRMSGGEIRNNSAKFNSYGGGVYVLDGDANFDNVVFSSNTAERHGGAVYADFGKTTLRSCTFTDNASNQDGGAIYVGRDAEGVYIYETEMNNNTSQAGKGGAVAVRNLTAFIVGCDIHDNYAKNEGGGVFLGDDKGAVLNIAGRCVIDNNTSGDSKKSNLTVSSSGILNFIGSRSIVNVGWLEPGSRIGLNNDGTRSKDEPLVSGLNELDKDYFFGDNGEVNFKKTGEKTEVFMATAMKPFGYAIYMIIALEIIGAAIVIVISLNKRKKAALDKNGGDVK